MKAFHIVDAQGRYKGVGMYVDSYTPTEVQNHLVGSGKYRKGVKAFPNTMPKDLICSCCGTYARGRQWGNRDTGYGLCTRCADWLPGQGYGPDEMYRLYGARGVHYDLNFNPVSIKGVRQNGWGI